MKTSTAIRNLKKCKPKGRSQDYKLHRDLGYLFRDARNDRESYLGTGFNDVTQASPPPLLGPLF